VEWLVARSLCVCRAVEASGVKAGELDALLALQVREWAPFSDPEYYYLDMGNRLLVWAWDGELRRSRCREAGVRPDLVLPESVVRPLQTSPTEESELLLVPCWEGFEAREFRQGRLVQTRWWCELPSLAAWNRSRLLVDLPPLEALPEFSDTADSDSHAAPLREMLIPFLRAESTLFVLLFALFLVAGAYQLSAIAYAAVSSSRVESRIEELNSAVTPVLAARDAAMGALDTIENISSLHAGPLQLQYLSDTLDRLAAERARGRSIELVAWEYKPGAVVVSVEAEALSPAELLTIFEAVPWMTEPRVGEDPVKSRQRVTGQLLPGWRFPEAEPPKVAER
jgi:hypothetical protein